MKMQSSNKQEFHDTFHTSRSAREELEQEEKAEGKLRPPDLKGKQAQIDQGDLKLSKVGANDLKESSTLKISPMEFIMKWFNQSRTEIEILQQSSSDSSENEKNKISDKDELMQQRMESESTDLTDLEEVESSHLPPDLDPALVNHFFKVLFAAILFMSIDLGILPACTVKMQKELGIGNTEFGLLGSVVYLGQTFGAVMATILLQKVPPKIFLFVCLVCNMVSLIYFTISDNFNHLLICRMFTGLFQIFFGVYQPVWADIFGNERQKSLWISYLIIATPLGTIIGYLMTAFFQDNIGWRFSFYVQALLLTPSMFYILLIPRKYQDVKSTGQAIKEYQLNQKKAIQTFNDPRLGRTPLDFDEEKQVESQEIVNPYTEGSLRPPTTDQEDKTTKVDLKDYQISLVDGLKLIFKNKEFTFMCGAITSLYFVVTGIQFWFSDYMITEMGMDKQVVFTWFGIVSITGPILGVFVGGQITTCLGGYTSMANMYSILIMSVFSVCFALPIPFLKPEHSVLTIGLLWLELFTGGYMLPSMTGILLNTVDQELKTSANSLANTCYNIFGFLPAPIIFGCISDYGPKVGGNKHTAMIFLMSMPVLAVFFLFSAALSLKKKGFGKVPKQYQGR